MTPSESPEPGAAGGPGGSSAGIQTASPAPAAPSGSTPSPDTGNPDDQVNPDTPRSGTRAYAPGEEIFSPRAGQAFVYVVRTGCVRLDKPLLNGRSITLGLLGPNTIFTQEADGEGLGAGARARALVASSVSIVEVDDLAALVSDSPELAAAVVSGMTRRLTELQTLIEHLLARDATIRLAAILLALATRFGQPRDQDWTTIALPLTHQDLADMLGANRVTVTRKLRDLQARHTVRPAGRNRFEVDMSGLKSLVDRG